MKIFLHPLYKKHGLIKRLAKAMAKKKSIPIQEKNIFPKLALKN
jgi:hypothetical protein